MPLSFELGKGRVIKGWEEGIAGMKGSSKHKLIVPPELGFGSASFLDIPPNAEVHFEIDWRNVK